MSDDLERLIKWMGWGAGATGMVTMALGAFSAAAPAASIRLYQRIMEWFNWRVVPIDERRELRNTKTLGLLLVGLSLVLLWRLSAVRF